MTVKLGENPLRRLVYVPGLGDIIASVTKEGITFKAKGTKLGIQTTWSQLVGACTLPENVPDRFANRPYDFLKFQSEEHQKRMNKKLAEKIVEEIKACKAG
jgi:hypothetical protein